MDLSNLHFGSLRAVDTPHQITGSANHCEMLYPLGVMNDFRSSSDFFIKGEHDITMNTRRGALDVAERAYTYHPSGVAMDDRGAAMRDIIIPPRFIMHGIRRRCMRLRASALLIYHALCTLTLFYETTSRRHCQNSLFYMCHAPEFCGFRASLMHIKILHFCFRKAGMFDARRGLYTLYFAFATIF